MEKLLIARQTLDKTIARENMDNSNCMLENTKAGTKRKKKIKHLLDFDNKDTNPFLVCLFDRCVDVQKFTPSSSIYSMTRYWKTNCIQTSITKTFDDEQLKNCPLSGQADYIIDLPSISRPEFHTPGLGLVELKKRWAQVREFELKKARIKEKTFHSDIEVIRTISQT